MDSISPELIWLIVGLVFLFLEFLIPGVVLVFFGLGAFVTAALVWAGVFEGMTGQLLFFCGASLVFLFSLRRFVSRAFRGKVKANADYDDQGEYSGKTAKVSRSIRPGSVDGRVEFDGTEWKAIAAVEITEGTIVKIVAKENITFTVIPTESSETE